MNRRHDAVGRTPVLQRISRPAMWREHRFHRRLPHPQMNASWVKDVAVAVSLANLCCLKLWRALVYQTDYDLLFRQEAPGSTAILASLTNMALLAVLLLFAIRVARGGHAGAFVVLGLAGLFAAAAVRSALVGQAGVLRHILSQAGLGSIILPDILAISFTGAAVWLARKKLSATAYAIALILFPFAILTVARAAWLTISPQRMEDRANLQRTGSGERKIVIVVFDEWDYKLTFVNRPAGTTLPEIDAFAATAIRFTDAASPAEETLRAIPALLTGRQITAVREHGASDVWLRFSEGEWRLWSRTKTIFDRAAELKWGSAIVGWYLPYCRILGAKVQACTWRESSILGVPLRAFGSTFRDLQISEAALATETLFYRPVTDRAVFRWRADSIDEIVRNACTVLARNDLPLVFIHLPTSHAPFVWREGSELRGTSEASGYPHGLEATDRAIGAVRRLLERSRQWDSTTVLLTADHGFRELSLHRPVPFLLKLAGTKSSGRTISRKFSTLGTYELVSDLMTGTLTTPDSVERWVERQAVTR